MSPARRTLIGPTPGNELSSSAVSDESRTLRPAKGATSSCEWPATTNCRYASAGGTSNSLRTENGWSVIHHGRTPTERNGVALPPGVPTPLISGDRLSIAGALTVFVDFESTGGVQVPEVTLPTNENRAARLLLDATCGDMVNFE